MNFGIIHFVVSDIIFTIRTCLQEFEPGSLKKNNAQSQNIGLLLKMKNDRSLFGTNEYSNE